MQLVKSYGKMMVSESKKRIALDTSPEILDYYHWFLERKFWIKLQKPLHGSHITIYSSAFHSNINWKKASYYDKEALYFDYDVNVVQGGYIKGFIMFYLKVYSKELDDFKRDVGIVENSAYRGAHLTLGQAGKSGSHVQTWWPKMITVK